ncbi:MAG: YraN family protein [Pseudomonadota bacterium]
MTSKNLGKRAEDFAYHYLKNQGLSPITRNYTCRFGEIDLIMRDKHTLVFIEVRYRQNLRFGHSVETVHLAKQLKLIKTAEYYLLYNTLSEGASCRFDVFAISPPEKSITVKKLNTSQHYPAQVEWVKNAFSR